MRPALTLAVLAVTLTVAAASPAPAAAVSPVGVMCTIGGVVSGLIGKACNAAQHAGRVLSAGKQLLGGHVGSALKALGGGAGTAAKSLATKATFVVGLTAIGDWIGGGAHAALGMVAELVDRTTRPQLRSSWFSGTYWRVAGISALLTLPFLFAAAIQSLLRADMTLLWRAALGYLPLALLAVGIATPLTMLVLAATDGMSDVISSAGGSAGSHFLDRMAGLSGGLTLLSRSPFLSCFLGVLLVVVSVVLWLEMLVRNAAIYIVVLMLPLVFATVVWPARRVWATRSIELLFALILSKFAVVAVLSLGGAALNAGGVTGVGRLSVGLVLVALAATAPWVMVRLLPMAELAASLHGIRSGTLPAHAQTALGGGEAGHSVAREARALPAGDEPAEDPAAQEVAKLTAATGPTRAGGQAPEEATLVPDPQLSDLRVAGFGSLPDAVATLSPDERRDLEGDGTIDTIGEEGQGRAQPGPVAPSGSAPDDPAPSSPAPAPTPPADPPPAAPVEQLATTDIGPRGPDGAGGEPTGRVEPEPAETADPRPTPQAELDPPEDR